MSNIIKGEWSLVQWNPDIATEEYLNIGVSFKHNGRNYFKMLDSFNRVNCLYDEDTVLIYAELSGDFPLGDSRQPTYKSLRPFDLVS